MAQRLSNADIRTLVNPVLAAAKTISGATSANPCVVTATAHGYAVGDYVVIYGAGGMASLNGIIFKISASTTNTFTVPANATGDVYVSGGSAQKITAGLAAKLKRYQITALQSALDRVRHVENADKDSGSAESAIEDIFPAGGLNP